MNRNLALSLIALACAAGNAVADDITIDPFPFVSTASRAEVIADLHAHRAAGVNPWADEYNPLDHFVGMKTRAQVTAEYMAERQQVAAFMGEDSGSTYLAQRVVDDAPIQLAGLPEIEE